MIRPFTFAYCFFRGKTIYKIEVKVFQANTEHPRLSVRLSLQESICHFWLTLHFTLPLWHHNFPVQDLQILLKNKYNKNSKLTISAFIQKK